MQLRKTSVSVSLKRSASPCRRGTRGALLIAAGVAAAAVVGGIAGIGPRGAAMTAPAMAQAPAAAPAVPWVAAAPGRVEPKSGLVRISAGVIGKVEQVLVRQGDKVEDGDLMFRIADEEPRARLAAAEAEVEARKKERDDQPATKGREDLRRAEDGIYLAERALTNARFALDQAITNRSSHSGREVAVSDARKALADARDKLRKEHIAYANAQSKGGIPSPNRLESAVIAARADVAVADALLDKTRVRAPLTGTILVVNVKAGETVAPSAEMPLLVMGDLSVLRVKAEVSGQEETGAEPEDAAGPATPEEEGEPAQENAAAEEDATAESGSLRLARIQRAEQQSQKSAQETLGVAMAFEGIREELINNRVDTEERKARLKELIADPLRNISEKMFPELNTRLTEVQKLHSDAQQGPQAAQLAIDETERVLTAMNEVLNQMLDLETYNELVDIVRSLIKDQEQIIDGTKKQRRSVLFEP